MIIINAITTATINSVGIAVGAEAKMFVSIILYAYFVVVDSGCVCIVSTVD